MVNPVPKCHHPQRYPKPEKAPAQAQIKATKRPTHGQNSLGFGWSNATGGEVPAVRSRDADSIMIFLAYHFDELRGCSLATEAVARGGKPAKLSFSIM
jgi:hypothetical protein